MSYNITKELALACLLTLFFLIRQLNSYDFQLFFNKVTCHNQNTLGGLDIAVALSQAGDPFGPVDG